MYLQVYWKISNTYGLKKAYNRWYEHQHLQIVENKNVKLPLGVTIYTNKIIRHNRSNKALLLKKDKECIFINIAVPADHNTVRTQYIKIHK